MKNMATDLKIEIFAFKLFHKIWYDNDEIENEPDVLEFYGDECARDDSYLEALDDIFIKAFYFRSEIFLDIYVQYLSTNHIKDFTSLFEVYDYIIHMCDRDDLFGNLTVFDRIWATCDFVIEICYFIRSKISRLKDILKYGHIFWTMYFDKFTDEFYAEGGWNKLKIVAKSYDPLRFFRPSNECLSLNHLKEAAVNYNEFKKTLQYNESKKQKNQLKICCSTLWVKFRIQLFDDYINIPRSYKDYADIYEIHCLLDDVRRLCDPFFGIKINFTEATQENNQQNNFFIEKVNNFKHSLIMDDCLIFSDEVDIDITKNLKHSLTDTYIPTEIAIPIYNVINFETTECKENLLLNLIMYKQIETNGKLPSIVADDHKSSLYVNDNEEFYSRNLEGKSPNWFTAEKFSVKKNEPEYIIEKPTEIQYNSYEEHVYESISNVKNTGNLKEVMEDKINSENARQNEIRKTKNDAISKQMAEYKWDGKNRDIKFRTVNRCINTGEGIERVQKLNVLRNEHNDDEIKSFLRLILILGDKQGLRFVRETFSYNKEGHMNLQEKSKKEKSKKKNSKNKV